jgi:hypothetical protein
MKRIGNPTNTLLAVTGFASKIPLLYEPALSLEA